jgi:hypothetical protein
MILLYDTWEPFIYWDGRIFDVRCVRVRDCTFSEFFTPDIPRCCEVEINQIDVDQGWREYSMLFFDTAFAPVGLFDLGEPKILAQTMRTWLHEHLQVQFTPLAPVRWGKVTYVEYR